MVQKFGKRVFLGILIVLLSIGTVAIKTTGQVVVQGAQLHGATVAKGLPNWPDALKYWGIIINATDAINWHITNHPTSFLEDKLVTELNALNVNYADTASILSAAIAYANARDVLTSHGIALGSYISGTNVGPLLNQNRYPFSMVRKEGMPATAKYLGNWGGTQSWRQFIDPSDPTTTTAFHNLIAADWALLPNTHWRFVDNSSSLEGGTAYGAFADQMANVHAINLVAQSQGARAFFNASIIVGVISPANMNLLLAAIAGGGICLESPLPNFISSSPSALASAQAQYRQILDAGDGVIMLGASATSTTQATSAQLKAWVSGWRKPTDHLYIARNFYQAPDPAILDWP